MSKSNFIVRGGADFSSIPKALQKLQGQFNGFGKTLGAGLKVAAASIVVKKLWEFGKEAVQVASDLQEVQNVVDVTFGSMSKQVNDFASDSIKQFGLSELSAKKFSSTMGAMLKSSGISGQAVTDMSIEVAKLTADMASFYNLDAEEAFTKIRSGLSGETEPLKQLGINMSVANIEAYAMSQGINKAWREMNQAEQTMLRYNYLLSVTGDAQGDFARNSGSWANQIKILKEQWKEFMGLVGKALIEVLTPIVKVLNELLGILINVVKEFGKMYTLITGKEATVETNSNIADTAMDAAEGEEELADGIGKAAKAAKKALASFDELNILQSNLNGGGGSGGLAGAVSNGGLNTMMSTKQVDDGIKLKIDYEEPEKFFMWYGDHWRKLRQEALVPVVVAAPVFEPIPNPVYEPNWGLEYPALEPVVIPTIDDLQYQQSLEGAKLNTSKAWNWITEKVAEMVGKQNLGLRGAWDTMEKNYQTHKENMGSIANSTSEVVVKNTNQGLSKVGINSTNTMTTTQSNWNMWGRNLGGISAETARAFTSNLNEGFKVTNENTVAFANAEIRAMESLGVGMLKASAQTAEGMANNYTSGFSTIWDNFKRLKESMGEKVSGWFNANKKVITTVAIVGAGALVAGGLALAAPAAIPYAAAALGGLASIPGLAKGGITSGPMLAMVGDNPGGKEVVSPLDGLLDMIVDAMSITNNNGSNINLTVKIGEDTIGERAISYINDKTIMTGESPILI